MRPDQLAHLTDEERRAWEERELAVKALRALTAYAPCRHDATDPAGTHWLKCSDCGRTVPRDHQSNAAADAYEAKAAKVYDAVRLLPAALEALADARRERDEARAELANERGEGEPPSEGWGWDSAHGADCWAKMLDDGRVLQVVRDGLRWKVLIEAAVDWSYRRLPDPYPTARAAMLAADAVVGGGE